MISESLILLGTNLGDRMFNLNRAVALIEEERFSIVQISSVYSTKAWGNPNQDDFLNVVIKGKTKLDAKQLLQSLLAIELKMGRKRNDEKWMPRIIDLDILYFNDEVLELPDLRVPHPFIAQRKFTLIPLVEIAPWYVHPVLKLNHKQLLENCDDTNEVVKTEIKLQLKINSSDEI